jgi:hypothetical protein
VPQKHASPGCGALTAQPHARPPPSNTSANVVAPAGGQPVASHGYRADPQGQPAAHARLAAAAEPAAAEPAPAGLSAAAKPAPAKSAAAGLSTPAQPAAAQPATA